MKRYIQKAWIPMILLVGVIYLVSCEDMLEEKTYDFISDVEDSNEGADLYVMGTYSYLLDDMFRWNQFPKVLDMDCDYATGPDWSLSDVGAGNFQGESGMDPVWNKSYTLIHRANNTIESISKMSNVTEVHKLNAIGEMKFLKAWAYFVLVRAYGDVPVYQQSVNEGTDFNQPRQSVKVVFEHIISLLDEAEDEMYKNTDSNFTEGRASAGAAASLLAKVYVTIASAGLISGEIRVKGGAAFSVNSNNDKVLTNPSLNTYNKRQVAGYEELGLEPYFALARDKAKQVIDGDYGNYSLLPYGSLWSQASKNKTEHIWSIQGKSADAKYGLGVSSYYSGTENSDGVIITGLWHGCRDHWYKLFGKDDLRIKDGVMHRWIHSDHVSWDGGAFYPNTDEWSIKARGYRIDGNDTIYVDENNVDYVKAGLFDDGRNYTSDITASYIAFLTKYYDASDRTQEKTDVNWPVLRYADVLLIYAEAANEAAGAPTQDALDMLNLVRGRSQASLKSLSGLGNIGDLVSFRSAVLEERAMELALEGDRRWDLIRWGIYLDVMNSIGEVQNGQLVPGYDEVGIRKIREEKHLLYPIPTDEILTNTSINENNLGWN